MPGLKVKRDGFDVLAEAQTIRAEIDWCAFRLRISTEYVRPLADLTRKLEKIGCRESVFVMANTSSRARWRRLLTSSVSLVRQS